MLGAMPLAFSTSGLYQTVFLSFVALVIISVGHSLILLPVLLSTFGTEDQITVSALETVEHVRIEI